jgi:hypothetical protein
MSTIVAFLAEAVEAYEAALARTANPAERALLGRFVAIL